MVKKLYLYAVSLDPENMDSMLAGCMGVGYMGAG